MGGKVTKKKSNQGNSNKYNLRFNVKNVSDRINEIENILENYRVDRSKWVTDENASEEEKKNVGGEDYDLKKMADYIMKSDDIDTCRNIENSFYIDDRSFNNEYKYKKKGLKHPDRDAYSPNDYVFRTSVLDFHNEENFMINNVAISEYISSNSKLIYEDVVLDDLLDFFEAYGELQFIESVEFRVLCKVRLDQIFDCICLHSNDMDLDILELLYDGYTISEISKELDVPLSTVKYRISRIESKMAELFIK